MESTSFCAQKALFDQHGQGHIFEHFETLSPEHQAHLLDEARQIDPALINRLYKDIVGKDHHASGEDGE
jgi:hypothetical protein